MTLLTAAIVILTTLTAVGIYRETRYNHYRRLWWRVDLKLTVLPPEPQTLVRIQDNRDVVGRIILRPDSSLAFVDNSGVIGETVAGVVPLGEFCRVVMTARTDGPHRWARFQITRRLP